MIGLFTNNSETIIVNLNLCFLKALLYGENQSDLLLVRVMTREYCHVQLFPKLSDFYSLDPFYLKNVSGGVQFTEFKF